VAFARSYGVLGLLPDGRPGIAATDPHSSDFPPHHGEGADAWFREPLAGWRAYADHALAIVVLAAALRRGERIDPYTTLLAAGFDRRYLRLQIDDDHPLTDDDRLAYGRLGTFSLPELVENLKRVGSEDWATEGYPVGGQAAQQRVYFGHYVGKTWLKHGSLSPDISWQQGPARLTLARSNPWLSSNLSAWPEDSLFSVLAIQIASEVCADHGLVVCEDCGALLRKERSPRPDQPLRCSECAEAIHRKQKTDAARRRRARERATRATPIATPFSTPKPVDG